MIRDFRPSYVSLAPTYRCILNCSHCTVPHWNDVELSEDATIHFLEDCRKNSIKRLGITGGEPFLVPQFLIKVLGAAAKMGFKFDKIMTSAAWVEDEEKTAELLFSLDKTGYDGKFCISVDQYHTVAAKKIKTFILQAIEATGRGDICSLAYTGVSPTKGTEQILKLKRMLGAEITGSLSKGTAHLISPYLCLQLFYNQLCPVDRASKLGCGWDEKWFKEDWCEGPGQALYVNPKGEVKPCCGYANDLDALTIGNIATNSVKELIERGRQHPFVGVLYREGLSAIREKILSAHPDAFPGKTSCHCFFCWYVLTNHLWP